MQHLLRLLRLVGHPVAVLFLLVRDGDDDIQGTYPDHYRPTGEQAATQGSVAFNLLGMGH